MVIPTLIDLHPAEIKNYQFMIQIVVEYVTSYRQKYVLQKTKDITVNKAFNIMTNKN